MQERGGAGNNMERVEEGHRKQGQGQPGADPAWSLRVTLGLGLDKVR